MPLLLHEGGRVRAANAISGGTTVSATPLYLALFTAKNGSSTAFPAITDATTLTTLASWEVNVPGSGSYSRQRVDNILSVVSTSPSGYASITNSSAINFTGITLSRSIPGADTNSIAYGVITTQATSQASTDPLDIIAVGSLQSAITTFNNGDTVSFSSGTGFEIRVS